ncbi:MAG: hypothetical protein Q9217_004077 [Psora testacea]
MASLIVSPIPQRLGGSMSRRIPLGDVPNAANSPARTHAAAKRTRDHVQAQENFSCDVQPQTKRQLLEKDRSNLRNSPVKPSLCLQEDGVFNKRSLGAAQLTAFERRCLFTKEGKARQRVERQEKAPQETLEGIRQWQKHYKKAFPQFVFYFEGIPEDVRQKCSKWIRNLGARDEKFFSKDVTHVVTSRPIPATSDSTDGTALSQPLSISRASQAARTINPSSLDRQAETYGSTHQARDKFILEASTSRRPPMINENREVDLRRTGASNADILSKAQEMGMKVWQVEKLQRIMNTMHEVPHDPQTHHAQHARAKASNVAVRGEKEAELSRMLRNERLHGPSDRDPSVTLGEIVPFKGPFIYIRDIDERTKPILMKEFAKPTRKGDLGEWPQFRAVSHGKCPFVEEISKDDLIKERLYQEEATGQQQMVETRSVSRTRAAAREENYQDHDGDEDNADSNQTEHAQQPLQEMSNSAIVSIPPPAKQDVLQLCPPPAKLPQSPSKAQLTRPATARPNLFGGEPAASGLQPSNVTSAIRSQMISSTAAGPGVKAGTSKEVHGLKRKVLEKNAGPALSSIQTQKHPDDPTTLGRAENNLHATRKSRTRLQETLVHIDEESTQSAEDEDVWLAQSIRGATKVSKKAQKEKTSKPGYCENCREKYEDFDEHIVGRRHRKFALSQENWKDLDRLLAHLGRPLKRYESEGF